VTVRVPLGFNEILDEQKQLVMEALDDNQTSRAKFTARLEELIARICGVKRAVFMASGTCALHLALECRKKQMGWPDGANVIVPATTFIASLAAVRHAGLTPVLCDVRPHDFNIDPELAHRHNAVAIMAVHLLGRPCEMDRLIEVADAAGADIIEDCCESFGCKYKGKPLGSFGVAGAMSTYASHHLSTGTGGALITNDDWIADKALSLMQHGIADSPHVFNDWGYSFRSTEMEAALGVGMLENGPVWTARQQGRRLIAHWISEALKDFEPRIWPQAWPHISFPMFYPIVCDDPLDRDPLIAALEAAGIPTRPALPVVTQRKVVEMLYQQGLCPADFPVAFSLTQRAFLIGCNPGVTQEGIECLRATVEGSFAGRHA